MFYIHHGVSFQPLGGKKLPQLGAERDAGWISEDQTLAGTGYRKVRDIQQLAESRGSLGSTYLPGGEGTGGLIRFFLFFRDLLRTGRVATLARQVNAMQRPLFFCNEVVFGCRRGGCVVETRHVLGLLRRGREATRLRRSCFGRGFAAEAAPTGGMVGG